MENKQINKLPRVSRLKFFANISQLFKNPIAVFSKLFEQHGNTFILRQGDIDLIFTRSAKIAEQVLQKNNRNYFSDLIVILLETKKL